VRFNLENVFTHTISGQFNGEPFNASGKIFVEENGDLKSTLNNQDIPSSFHSALALHSYICLICGGAISSNKTKDSVLNLSEGNFEAIRTYVIEDSKKNIKGSIATNVQVTKKSENEYLSNLHLVGHYKGPTDFIPFSGYEIEIRQMSPGRVGGQFKQNIETSDNETYTVYASTEYIYSTVSTISETKHWNVHFDKIQFTPSQIMVSGKISVTV